MKLIALGDNCVDVYQNLDEVHPGGNAVNVAVHAARCGAQAEYMGSFGTDGYSDVLRQALIENNVSIEHCPVLPGSTTKQCCYDVIDGERSFRGVIEGDSWAGPVRIGEKELAELKTADVIVTSCNAKIAQYLKEIENLPPVFVFDFGEKEKYRTEAYCEQVCGAIDLAMFSCDPMSDEEFRSFADSMHARNIIHVLATMGAQGQILSNGKEIIRKTVSQVIPHDTMGAGDSFLAAFVTDLAAAGWKKGEVMPVDVLIGAIEEGQRVSAENCLSAGGFGF